MKDGYIKLWLALLSCHDTSFQCLYVVQYFFRWILHIISFIDNIEFNFKRILIFVTNNNKRAQLKIYLQSVSDIRNCCGTNFIQMLQFYNSNSWILYKERQSLYLTKNLVCLILTNRIYVHRNSKNILIKLQ